MLGFNLSKEINERKVGALLREGGEKGIVEDVR
jgi:hypothetical protein